ncbi:glycoprotein 3-alpha-L-fucosyltransferase A-like isoform X1 [Biomphalaria glabrata]|nr:glycoprotein 3-alpha-L-fucosyltransferase A-like isoform X1 [Biomphalaria glabrata]
MDYVHIKSHYLKLLLIILVCFIALSIYWMSTRISVSIHINNKFHAVSKEKSISLALLRNPRASNGVLTTSSTFNVRNERSAQDLDKVIQRYLAPITKALHEDISIHDSISEHILRSGLGLEPYTTEKKEDIWIENGVQYRPYPFLEKADNPFYTSEFEAFVPFNKTEFFQRDEKSLSRDITDKKIILWWQHKIAQAPITGLNPLRACPDFPCVVTSDRKYTENSSALIINAQFVEKENPPNRRPDQVFIHYQIEAPFNYWFYGNLFSSSDWNGAFNWTMSYRMDSDITTYHGIVRRRRSVKERNYKEILAKKKGLIVWMVSNCQVNSKRHEYVRELQKYVPVDIYGKCGPFQCARINDRDCLREITLKYKFYLGFESNFCKDYITEKLYRYLDSDMIVVARGHNTFSRLVPSEIFLNTANFKSPRELADRILYLDTHEDEYIQMLKEKDKYFSIYEDYPLLSPGNSWIEYRYEAAVMCEVCRRLWNVSNYTKTYPDMLAWLYKKEYQCYVPNDIV